MNDHSRAIRGMSIAVLVFSIIGILGALACLIIAGTTGGIAAIGANDALYGGGLNGHHYGNGYYLDGSLDSEDAFWIAQIAAIIMGVALGYGIWLLICSAVTLVSAVMGMRYFNQPAKLGVVFGWSLAGAIVCFLSGKWITMVLLIITCVFAYTDKNAAKNCAQQQQEDPDAGRPQQPVE